MERLSFDYPNILLNVFTFGLGVLVSRKFVFSKQNFLLKIRQTWTLNRVLKILALILYITSYMHYTEFIMQNYRTLDLLFFILLGGLFICYVIGYMLETKIVSITDKKVKGYFFGFTKLLLVFIIFPYLINLGITIYSFFCYKDVFNAEKLIKSIFTLIGLLLPELLPKVLFALKGKRPRRPNEKNKKT